MSFRHPKIFSLDIKGSESQIIFLLPLNTLGSIADSETIEFTLFEKNLANVDTLSVSLILLFLKNKVSGSVSMLHSLAFLTAS